MDAYERSLAAMREFRIMTPVILNSAYIQQMNPRLIASSVLAFSLSLNFSFAQSAGIAPTGNLQQPEVLHAGHDISFGLPALNKRDLIKPENGVDYKPFDPKKWEEKGISTEMTAWNGENIAFLTLDDTIDPELITRLVRFMDQGWEKYAEIIPRKPRIFKNHKGLPAIAAVPEGVTCGAGCGYVGSTGIELALFYQRDLDILKKHPDSCPHYIFYEMGRNFYVYGDRHSYFATGFAVFMRYVCMDAVGCKDVELKFREILEGHEANIKNAEQLSFLEIFTNQGDKARSQHARKLGLSDSQNSNYASVMLHLRKQYGGDEWVKKFYTVLDTAGSYPVGAEDSPYLQSLSWLVTASIAAGEDLTPLFVERYRFPMPEEDRAKMAKVNWKKKKLRVDKIVSGLGTKPLEEVAE